MVLINLTSSDAYETFLNENPTSVVVFGMDGCLPCDFYRPTLEKVAQTSTVPIAYVELDLTRPIIDRREAGAILRGGVPLTMFRKDGRDVIGVRNPQSESGLVKMIADHLLA